MQTMTGPVKLAALVAGTWLGLTLAWRMCRRHRHTLDQLGRRVVVITGCDSGVGFSTAMHCHNRGFHVIAMVLNLNSNGARALSKVSGHMDVIAVDVTNLEQVTTAFAFVEKLLDSDKNIVFHALINNAGVMVFGETEWQTENLVSLQIDVNLSGSIRVARQFAPLLRNHKGRLVNVSSHCASLPLPGLAVYAGSKAGLQAWSDALRVEWAKYGITVISLVPGSFFQQTNILSRQTQYAKEMQEAMSCEAADFYGDYFTEYHQYLSGFTKDKPATVIQSSQFYQRLDSALLDYRPQAHYHITPWRYALYHRLAAISPTFLHDRLVTWFTAMPAFRHRPPVAMCTL